MAIWPACEQYLCAVSAHKIQNVFYLSAINKPEAAETNSDSTAPNNVKYLLNAFCEIEIDAQTPTKGLRRITFPVFAGAHLFYFYRMLNRIFRIKHSGNIFFLFHNIRYMYLGNGKHAEKYLNVCERMIVLGIHIMHQNSDSLDFTLEALILTQKLYVNIFECSRTVS